MAAAVRTSTVLGASSAVAAVAIMRCKRRAGEDASCTAGQRRDAAAARRGTAAAARCDRTHLATGLATVVNVAVEREDMSLSTSFGTVGGLQQLLLEAHIPTHFTRTLALKATPSVP